MIEAVELARQSLKGARTGWYRYLVAIWTITLALIVDWISERLFYSGTGTISVLDFKVARSAFSFTYSILFLGFVLWAMGSSRAVCQFTYLSANAIPKAALARAPEYRLWTLSPVNPSWKARVAFWILACHGLVLLATVAVIHLFQINMPDSPSLAAEHYRTIGILSGAVFGFSLFAFIRWIHPDWRRVYAWLTAEHHSG